GFHRRHRRLPVEARRILDIRRAVVLQQDVVDASVHVWSANDTLHLPGRLQGRCVAGNRNGGPVKCKGWFAATPQPTTLEVSSRPTRRYRNSNEYRAL